MSVIQEIILSITSLEESIIEYYKRENIREFISILENAEKFITNKNIQRIHKQHNIEIDNLVQALKQLREEAELFRKKPSEFGVDTKIFFYKTIADKRSVLLQEFEAVHKEYKKVQIREQ